MINGLVGCCAPGSKETGAARQSAIDIIRTTVVPGIVFCARGGRWQEESDEAERRSGQQQQYDRVDAQGKTGNNSH